MDHDLDFSRSRISWQNVMQVGDLQVSTDQILKTLHPMMTDERKQRLDSVVSSRSLHLVSVLENIYDRGNVSAVMRSSEAFGFIDMSLVDAPGAKFKAANRVTRGAEKWLDVKTYNSPKACVDQLHARGYTVWATDLATDQTIDSIDWLKPVAIVLGNEKEGISEDMRAAVDGRFRIPMLGFSQSFNISVAAALIFYRAHLEMRRLEGTGFLNEERRQQLLANYTLRCFDNPEQLLRRQVP